jgi:hypothetical protein|tara:strand:+ start:67 stop:702 length:636 start_codon:yes stop_codon:yes gene_type:complete
VIERFDMPELKDSFIGAWMMSDEITEPIVNFWSNPEVNSRATPGALGAKSTRNKYRKDSMEVAIHPDDYSGPWKKYRNALGRCVDDYRLKQYPDANEVEPFAVVERFNLQWYPPGGGFFVEHCENTGSKNSVYRHLVFMTYLNNVPDGGTKFKYQGVTTPALTGLTLVWPAGFTHTHSGQISKDHAKLILTGWISFKEIYNEFGGVKNDNI